MDFSPGGGPGPGWSDSPIFDAVSAWFRRLPAGEVSDPSWRSAGDTGWRAAEAAQTPVASGTTTAGLPIRKPQAHFIPGSVEPAGGPRMSVPPANRSPELVGQRLGQYSRGVRRARVDDPAPAPAAAPPPPAYDRPVRSQTGESALLYEATRLDQASRLNEAARGREAARSGVPARTGRPPEPVPSRPIGAYHSALPPRYDSAPLPSRSAPPQAPGYGAGPLPSRTRPAEAPAPLPSRSPGAGRPDQYGSPPPLSSRAPYGDPPPLAAADPVGAAGPRPEPDAYGRPAAYRPPSAEPYAPPATFRPSDPVGLAGPSAQPRQADPYGRPAPPYNRPYGRPEPAAAGNGGSPAPSYGRPEPAARPAYSADLPAAPADGSPAPGYGRPETVAPPYSGAPAAPYRGDAGVAPSYNAGPPYSNGTPAPAPSYSAGHPPASYNGNPPPARASYNPGPPAAPSSYNPGPSTPSYDGGAADPTSNDPTSYDRTAAYRPSDPLGMAPPPAGLDAYGRPQAGAPQSADATTRLDAYGRPQADATTRLDAYGRAQPDRPPAFRQSDPLGLDAGRPQPAAADRTEAFPQPTGYRPASAGDESPAWSDRQQRLRRLDQAAAAREAAPARPESDRLYGAAWHNGGERTSWPHPPPAADLPRRPRGFAPRPDQVSPPMPDPYPSSDPTGQVDADDPLGVTSRPDWPIMRDQIEHRDRMAAAAAEQPSWYEQYVHRTLPAPTGNRGRPPAPERNGHPPQPTEPPAYPSGPDGYGAPRQPSNAAARQADVPTAAMSLEDLPAGYGRPPVDRSSSASGFGGSPRQPAQSNALPQRQPAEAPWPPSPSQPTPARLEPMGGPPSRSAEPFGSRAPEAPEAPADLPRGIDAFGERPAGLPSRTADPFGDGDAGPRQVDAFGDGPPVQADDSGPRQTGGPGARPAGSGRHRAPEPSARPADPPAALQPTDDRDDEPFPPTAEPPTPAPARRQPGLAAWWDDPEPTPPPLPRVAHPATGPEPIADGGNDWWRDDAPTGSDTGPWLRSGGPDIEVG